MKKKKGQPKQQEQPKKAAGAKKRKSEFLLQHMKETPGVSFIERRDGSCDVFCESKYFYDEIKEPLEKYGFGVYCGKKKPRPTQRRRK